MALTTPQCFKTQGITKEEVHALRALERGEATDYQQRLALKLIMDKFCRTYDVSFVPGAADQSSFLAGRAFPGQQIVKYLKIDLTKLTDLEK